MDKRVNKCQARRPVWHGSDWTQRPSVEAFSRFWQGACAFICYCSVIRIEAGYSSLLSEWREFAFLAFSILQNTPNWLHVFKYLLPQRRNIIQAGKTSHPIWLESLRSHRKCGMRGRPSLCADTDILYFGGWEIKESLPEFGGKCLRIVKPTTDPAWLLKIGFGP